ncbi:SPOR domain-containing protein [Leptospira ellisii]|uniref:Cell division protein n=1 Tax=Leptospira ellisii TaxID=2023197 RepID=A0A2N0BNN9_9LEPT|nr:SPOR domain-containing protein [Leptospira ellisii]MDV6235998.1 SPOR domain-containing protein [Leptospira ellisii]PJZ94274.1 cell division protein [Leptospira ellisii]PKA05554.1 cell division protein [Leptospira ellisii]
MKEKIFYVINLDNKRILILSLFLLGLLCSFFFLGVSVGKKRAGSAEESLALNDIRNPEIQSAIPFSEPGQIPAEGNDTSSAREIPAASSASPSGPNRPDSVAFKNIPPAPEVVEFKKSNNVSSSASERESKSEPETLSVKEPEGSKESKKIKRSEEKKSKRVSAKTQESEESNGYSLQVAAFKEKEKADELKKTISGKEKNTKATVKRSRNGYYTVRFGSASSKKEAEGLASKLPAKLRSGVIVVKD